MRWSVNTHYWVSHWHQKRLEIAFEYADENNLSGFSEDKEIGGYKWFYAFMKHHDKLCVKKCHQFIPCSSPWVIPAHHRCMVWPVPKSAGTTKHNWSKIHLEHQWAWVRWHGKSEKGCKDQEHKAVSDTTQWKPRWTTMLTYVSAAGFALPPMVIHRGKYHDSWCIGAQPCILVWGSKKGYITKLFTKYGKMLIYQLQAPGQLDKTNLLLMDSHYVHVFNYCFMQMMYHWDIKVFALEPHISHWGQPLDKHPFSAFKDAFNEGMWKFNRRVGGRGIQKSEFFAVFNLTWEKSMTVKNIKAGYKRTGVWPVNRAAIPSYVTEPSKICKSKVVFNVIYSILLCLFWLHCVSFQFEWSGFLSISSVIWFCSTCINIFSNYRLCRRWCTPSQGQTSKEDPTCPCCQDSFYLNCISSTSWPLWWRGKYW